MFAWSDNSSVWYYLISQVVVVVGLILAYLKSRDAAIQSATNNQAIKAQAIASDVQNEIVTAKVDEAAQKAIRVKRELEWTTRDTATKLDALKVVISEVKDTGDKIHALTNSAMSATLKALMVSQKQVLDMTQDDEARGRATEAYEAAKMAYEEHEKAQASIDAGKAGDGI